MIRYQATISYDGKEFKGFQCQSRIGIRTVQGEIEKILSRISNQHIRIHGASRTDAGVHAIGQVIHFDFPKKKCLEKLRFAMDSQLPNDILIKKVEIINQKKHCRYDVREKIYEFRVEIGKTRSPFKRFYTSYYPYSIEIDRIQKAIIDLLGTHDFASFCASGSSVINTIRTIYEAKVEVNKDQSELLFTFRGTGFLYKMIRIIVGTLLKIGNGRMPVNCIPMIIKNKNRSLAGPTASPEGLYLKEILYN